MEWAAEAELYATLYPERASLIRQVGGPPARCDFAPPEEKLIRAGVTGRQPAARRTGSALRVTKKDQNIDEQ